MLSQGGHHYSQELLEIVRVYLQLLRVQHAQIFVCGLDVIHVLHSFLQTFDDNLSVSRHFGVRCYSSRIVEVSKATKVPLSPGLRASSVGKPPASCENQWTYKHMHQI
uniref:Uncharacterized protein n=1 Tax=Cyprinodon variegatus TaxID=28743 RepID=A0A3Q2D127_CYPVA